MKKLLLALLMVSAAVQIPMTSAVGASGTDIAKGRGTTFFGDLSISAPPRASMISVRKARRGSAWGWEPSRKP